MASDHEASVESFAKEWEALIDATQVLQSETLGSVGQTYFLSGALRRTRPARPTHLRYLEVQCWRY